LDDLDEPILLWAIGRRVSPATRFRWGLQFADRTLPLDEVPASTGIGANEIHRHGAQPQTVDFISSADCRAGWELNIWYHVSSTSASARASSGETDFPASTTTASAGRTYAKLTH